MKTQVLSLCSSDWAYATTSFPGLPNTSRSGQYSAEDPEGREFLTFPCSHCPKTGAPRFQADEIAAVVASFVYPPRLFIWGEVDENDATRKMEWEELYAPMKALGLPGTGFWDEVCIADGMHRGRLRIHKALRGKAMYGINWWDDGSKAVKAAIAAKWEILNERHIPYVGGGGNYVEIVKDSE